MTECYAGTRSPASSDPPAGNPKIAEMSTTERGSARGARAIVGPSLAPVPPMGFNTWNHFGLAIDERLARETMQAMVDRGLLAAGYRYFNLDDGWMAPQRDSSGRLVADPERFGSGMAALAKEAHEMGLLFGLYSDCGHRTCGGLPASYGHEATDAATFAEWEVDYLKHDWCHVPFEDFPGASHAEVAQELYGRMAEALVSTGRPVVLSMCSWGDGRPWEWARGLAHLWRTTPDITDSFTRSDSPTWGVVPIFHRNARLADWAGPGGWNDPDMLEVGNGGMSEVEYKSHFALWCLMAAPLLIGCDVRRASEETIELLTNKELVALDQDPLGQQARLVASEGSVHTLVKQLADGWAVGLFNEGPSEATVNLDWAALAGQPAPPGGWLAKDCWTGAEKAVSGADDVTLRAHETLVWRLWKTTTS
jgi:alpha-galactosidase